MGVRYGNGHRVLSPSGRSGYIKAEMIFDAEALVGSDVQICNKRVRSI